MAKTLLITGSSGFLGQHLVKLIHERNVLDITKVVLFDLKPFTKQLDYTDTITQDVIIGDITNKSDVIKAVKGVDFVIHTCGCVSIQTFPDASGMERVNVQGTKNMIDACIDEGVQYLVYTSSESVIMENRDFYMSDETVLYPDEQSLLMKPYGITKHRAEKLVLNAHGTALPRGGCLQTAALRPMGIYGEGEQAFLTEMIKRASVGKSTFIKLSYWRQPHQNDHQIIYAGNAAWAHLCTMKSLYEFPDNCGGEAYFVTDDTPPGTYNSLCEPFIHAAGFRYANVSIPSTVFLAFLYIFESLLTIVSSLVKINLPSTTNAIWMVNLNGTFTRKKIETKCYSPLYSYPEALKRSIPYYNKIIKT